jgi:hypothetical protein
MAFLVGGTSHLKMEGLAAHAAPVTQGMAGGMGSLSPAPLAGGSRKRKGSKRSKSKGGSMFSFSCGKSRKYRKKNRKSRKVRKTRRSRR